MTKPDRPDGDGLLARCLEFLLNDNKKARTVVIAASEFADFVRKEIARATSPTRDALEPECGWANRVAVLEAALDDEAGMVRILRRELTECRKGAEGAEEADEFGYFELGRSFYEEFTRLSNDGNFKGFICGCSPVEILVHLINERNEAKSAPDASEK